jgi:hypothetical protein
MTFPERLQGKDRILKVLRVEIQWIPSSQLSPLFWAELSAKAGKATSGTHRYVYSFFRRRKGTFEALSEWG